MQYPAPASARVRPAAPAAIAIVSSSLNPPSRPPLLAPMVGEGDWKTDGADVVVGAAVGGEEATAVGGMLASGSEHSRSAATSPSAPSHVNVVDAPASTATNPLAHVTEQEASSSKLADAWQLPDAFP
eukprot:scaffold63_cov306-Pinguiococcus_pyrenoidosus.AAC.11